MIISRYDSMGAGSVAFNVYRGLKAIGHDTKLLVENEKCNNTDVVSLHSYNYYKLRELVSKFLSRVKKLKPHNTKSNWRYAPYSMDEHRGWYRTSRLIRSFPFKPDVIIYLFMNSYINSRNAYELSQTTKAQTIFYPMDMALMTGGCHYSWECTRYFWECGKCPALYSGDPEDISFQNLKSKKKYLSQMDFKVLASGEQILGQLKQSSLFGERKIIKCLEPIDPETFKPGDIELSKNFFEIDKSKKVIFFGAVNVHDSRKGFTYLLKALDILYHRIDPNLRDKVHILIAGNDDSALRAEIKFPCLSAGFLKIDSTLPIAFRAADVFACPSVQDSGPMMINQSIMCGTPVVAFRQGVAIDIVSTGETGYLASMCDPDDFAKGLATIIGLNDSDHSEMRDLCRTKGMEETSIKRAGSLIDMLVNV